RHHRFGDANRGNSICAELRDEEDVNYGEERLHGHFHDHGNGEKYDCAADRAYGEVLLRAANRLAQGRPEIEPSGHRIIESSGHRVIEGSVGCVDDPPSKLPYCKIVKWPD